MQPIKRGVVKLARRQKRIQDGDVTLETLRRAWIMLLPQWASSNQPRGRGRSQPTPTLRA
jgi:hypothetical protein